MAVQFQCGHEHASTTGSVHVRDGCDLRTRRCAGRCMENLGRRHRAARQEEPVKRACRATSGGCARSWPPTACSPLPSPCRLPPYRDIDLVGLPGAAATAGLRNALTSCRCRSCRRPPTSSAAAGRPHRHQGTPPPTRSTRTGAQAVNLNARRPTRAPLRPSDQRWGSEAALRALRRPRHHLQLGALARGYVASTRRTHALETSRPPPGRRAPGRSPRASRRTAASAHPLRLRAGRFTCPDVCREGILTAGPPAGTACWPKRWPSCSTTARCRVAGAPLVRRRVWPDETAQGRDQHGSAARTSWTRCARWQPRTCWSPTRHSTACRRGGRSRPARPADAARHLADRRPGTRRCSSAGWTRPRPASRRCPGHRQHLSGSRPGTSACGCAASRTAARSPQAYRQARDEFSQAIAFQAWLHGRQRELADCLQADVDAGTPAATPHGS